MTNDDNTTDRHDESDREQFGDTAIAGTHLVDSHCHDCGTHVVKHPDHDQPRCIDCHRKHAGVEHASGANVGEHHPTIPSVPRTETAGASFTKYIVTYKEGRTQWRWGCLYCLETGQADNATHATALHQIHLAYACPGKPGLYPSEIKLRIARRKAREKLYPDEVPPFTPNNAETL